MSGLARCDREERVGRGGRQGVEGERARARPEVLPPGDLGRQWEFGRPAGRCARRGRGGGMERGIRGVPGGPGANLGVVWFWLERRRRAGDGDGERRRTDEVEEREEWEADKLTSKDPLLTYTATNRSS